MVLHRLPARLAAAAGPAALCLALLASTCMAASVADGPDIPSAQADVVAVSAYPASSVEDGDEPPAVLAVGSDGTEMRLAGALVAGTADRAAAFLAKHPGIGRLHLESGGGLVGEAFALAALVGAYALDTEVTGECASACTLVYVRGRNRTLGPLGRLGFHGPYEIDLRGDCRAVDARSEREAYLRAGLDPEFVAQALAGESETMWFPDAARLRSAGAVTGTTSTTLVAGRAGGRPQGIASGLASAVAP